MQMLSRRAIGRKSLAFTSRILLNRTTRPCQPCSAVLPALHQCRGDRRIEHTGHDGTAPGGKRGWVVSVGRNCLITPMLHTAFSFFFSCQGRVYSVTLLANFLVGIPFRRESTTMDGSTALRSPPGQHSSAIGGVEFDIVDGYDTESAFHQSLNAPRRGTQTGPHQQNKTRLRSKLKDARMGETKALLERSAEPVPYNYVCPKLITRHYSGTKS